MFILRRGEKMGHPLMAPSAGFHSDPLFQPFLRVEVGCG